MGFWTRRNWMTLGAVGGFVAVAVGAFAAHGVRDDPRAAELLRTGATYGFMHTMATFASATFMQVGARRARFAPGFFLSGVALFSGSLYALALGAPDWVGAITPVGGLLFLAGWATLAWAARGVDPH
ncbi:DUF423 domain-containing protein [Phenylobacterium sp.]|uniref:DUF423 domain-containing protein n=1 Tax=Phenylobacterium sp. TaxID=1871053 RepID=UPI0025DFD85E|nr:DUF423 domain-containing protein [Phenylobacterium sp.]MBX3483775.1 DUF423 domain-containing protein [Phenylobacterium sp.]MCW5758992.1 DUF423 domain-containing protein [Phenylobacterium sp.]